MAQNTIFGTTATTKHITVITQTSLILLYTLTDRKKRENNYFTHTKTKVQFMQRLDNNYYVLYRSYMFVFAKFPVKGARSE